MRIKVTHDEGTDEYSDVTKVEVNEHDSLIIDHPAGGDIYTSGTWYEITVGE